MGVIILASKGAKIWLLMIVDFQAEALLRPLRLQQLRH
jgi:hypothetical protein